MKYYLVRLECLRDNNTNFLKNIYPNLRKLKIDNSGYIWDREKKDIITYTGNHVQKTKETIFKYYDEIQLPYYIPVEFSEDRKSVV